MKVLFDDLLRFPDWPVAFHVQSRRRLHGLDGTHSCDRPILRFNEGSVLPFVLGSNYTSHVAGLM